MKIKNIMIITLSAISIICFTIIGYQSIDKGNSSAEKNGEDYILSGDISVLNPISEKKELSQKDSRNLQKSPSAEVSINTDELYSDYVLLVNTSDKSILLDKDSNKKMYPASMTKIMTAITAIEHLPSLEEKAVISPDMFPYLIEENASVAGFFPNEEISIIDLIYGTILPSGADASIALAEYIAGSEEKFAELMNEKAKQLQMENTNFTNVTGLHDPNHYSTAQDIAALMQYALKNPIFYEVITSEKHIVGPTNMHPEGITLESTLFSNLEHREITDKIILGGKTGFTSEAGQCLASFAQVNGDTFILVTAGAKGDHRTEPLHILDAIKVYKNINFR